MIITEKPNRSGSINAKFEETYSVTYQVLTDSIAYPADVVAFVGINIGDAYDSGNACCININPKQVSDDGKTWDIDYHYGKREPMPSDPTQEPARIVESVEHLEKPYDEDRDGVAITNSAGMPFLDHVMGDDSRPTIHIEKNSWTWNRNGFLKYRDVINKGTWWGFENNTLKVQDIGSERIWSEEFDQYYYKIHLELAYDPKYKWAKRVLDCGLMQWNPFVEKLENILDDNGVGYITEPVPLDGAGKALPKAPPIKYEFLTFNIYNEMDFSVFNWMLT